MMSESDRLLSGWRLLGLAAGVIAPEDWEWKNAFSLVSFFAVWPTPEGTLKHTGLQLVP